MQDDTKPFGGTKVTFTVAGVNSENNRDKLATSKNVSLNEVVKTSSLSTGAVPKNVSLEVGQSVENIESSFDNIGIQRDVSKGGAASKVIRKTASISPIASARKFRVVLIDSLGKIKSTIQTSVDQVISFDLVEGDQYTWYAYSYDDENDIPEPILAETIETPTDKDFLYARSSAPFTAVKGNNPINILFEHQLALVSIELDYNRLFAKIPTNATGQSSVSNNFNWLFSNTPDFLFKGVFSLRTGLITNQQLYNPDINQILKDHPNNKNTKVAECYTAPPPTGVTAPTSFSVTLNSLKITYPNTPAGQVVSLFPSPFSNTFSSLSISPGKKYTARFKLNYTFPKLNILHVTRSSDYAYAAEPRYLNDNGTGYNPNPLNNLTSFNMIKADLNFGLLENSIVRTNGFGHRRISHNFLIDTALHLSASSITPPDIVIIGTYYEMDQNDAEALVQYVNGGGVLFLMSDGVNDSDYKSHQKFFKLLFNDNNVTSNKTGFDGGSVYKLSNYNDEILNGPFGNIRSEHWGEDASATIALQNYPTADIIEYSASVPENATNGVSVGATMVRHKRKHLFWVGDGGFIACNEVSGAHGSPSNPASNSWGSYANQPFATATASDKTTHKHPYPYLSKYYEYFPVSRPFGYAGNGLKTYDLDVYNSTVFANFMSWAIVNATFFGINTGGLNPDFYYEF